MRQSSSLLLAGMLALAGPALLAQTAQAQSLRCDKLCASWVLDAAASTDVAAAIDAAVAGLPAPVSATLRMRVATTAASAAVAEARQAVEEAVAGRGIDEAVVAGSLRVAAESLAEVTGAAIGTDLLDRIFSRHCIGK